MYKKLNFDQLVNIDNKLLKNLKNLYSAKRYDTLKQFLKDIFSDGNDVYFFESNEPTFKFSKLGEGNYAIFDEKESIELVVDKDDLNKMHNLMKNDKKIHKINKENKSEIHNLFQEFMDGGFRTIGGKPYLVYDIETPNIVGGDLRGLKFILGYAFVSNDEHGVNLKYRYVSEKNLGKFVDFMLNFDGRIVGFNNMYFDNPVSLYNMGYDQKEIDVLNAKSLDLFMFVWNLTGRRIGLNKISSALVSVKKTLSISDEGAELIKKYLQDGDKSHLTRVKTYCKNDVKMTVGTLLYMLKYQNIYLDSVDYEYDEPKFIELANTYRGKKDDNKEENTDPGLF